MIDRIIADGTSLQILPRKPGKLPLNFAIHRLSLRRAGTEVGMDFDAVLTNAKPPGEIHSSGKFGPWQADEPSATPVSGTYRFQHADLSVFRGISGILSSDGRYRGQLDYIEVDGATDVPDFAVGIGGNRLHLTTQYHAIVDGTDGDTYLQPVTARFGKTVVTARGSVAGTPGIKGKTVSLDAVVREGRLEDVLRLGVRGKTVPMNGDVGFRTKLVIPPGEASITEKLQLDGRFEIDEARFTKAAIQRRITELSNRGKGEPEKEDGGSVASDFRGSFRLDHGVMTFRDLTFQVPSVELTLNGTYGLLDEKLNFHGSAKLQAPLSETTTGLKSFLLKLLNPFFSRKKAGTVLPIKIEGRRTAPSFGLDLMPGR